jgi:cytochrome c oxidase subunit II
MISKWAKFFMVAAAVVANMAPNLANADRYNLQTPQTIVAREIYDLHTLIFAICCVIFVLVFGAMFYSIFKHRKSVGHKAEQFHENTTVEIVWTVVPLLILIGMAYPATKTVIQMKDTSNPDITIKATGYQWKWGYDYLAGEGQGVKFFSSLATSRELINDNTPEGHKNREATANYLLEVDNPVVVPVGKKVRIITTADDVIHAWWVPAFGVKQDAIPGFVRDTWFKVDKAGIYRGQCAELCGKEHGFMPIVVEAVDAKQYTDWVDGQKKKMTAAGASAGALDGKAVYDRTCQVCHATGVAGAPKFGDKAAWQARIAQGQDTLYAHALKGFKGMPPKGGAADLADAQIKAAVDFIVAAGK